MWRDKPSICLEYLLNSPSIPSPCFVLDVERLLLNMNLLDEVQKRTGVKILLALKAFAAWSVFPLISREGSGPLFGTCASSVDEALLGKEKFGGEVHAFAPAWTKEEILELKNVASHISFNSLSQWKNYKPLIESHNKIHKKSNPLHIGLRINPEYSESALPLYDPCAPGSHLGVRLKDMPEPVENLLGEYGGFHFHTLCEQNSSALVNTLKAFDDKFSPYFPFIHWFNFGGGHHITRDGYDVDLLCDTLNAWEKKYDKPIYLEPGEAVALDAGWLVTTILDVIYADIPILIMDTSAACHMPDVLEMPYTPDLWYKSSSNKNIVKAGIPGEFAFTCRVAGKSCLAGDVVGEYSFNEMPKVGERMVFGDMAIYSMVKTNTFNGLRLPSIALHDFREKDPFKVLRAFGYEDFKNRLS